MSKEPSLLRVELPVTAPQTYDILIGNSLLDRIGDHLKARLGTRRCITVTDTNVAPLYLDRVEVALRAAGHEMLPSFKLPAGEATKCWPHANALLEHMAAAGADRRTLLLALGGGVVGDLAGFSASIYMRGIDFLQVPTTLLAQTDSSVGGKTGINAPFGKNTIGTFHQPRLVLADVSTLNTLPLRELRAGYAEIAKYGLIMNEPYFAWCETNGAALLGGDVDARTYAVEKSCALKAQIVIEDEKENGRRALLNLGHTFGHALEAATGFSDKLLHGEAVAIGTVMAFQLSARLGLCAATDSERVEKHYKAVGLPTLPPQQAYDIEALMRSMAADKKAEGGSLTLILAEGIGKGIVVKNAEPAPIRALWRDTLAKLSS